LRGAPVEIIGNHGAEPQAKGVDVRRVIARAKRAVVPIVKRWPGAWLEDKIYSLSVHYRQAEETPTGPARSSRCTTARRHSPRPGQARAEPGRSRRA
jgi:trehalose-6-phosphatase